MRYHYNSVEYGTALAAAKAYAKDEGISGRPGGWLYSASGTRLIRGWGELVEWLIKDGRIFEVDERKRGKAERANHSVLFSFEAKHSGEYKTGDHCFAAGKWYDIPRSHGQDLFTSEEQAQEEAKRYARSLEHAAISQVVDSGSVEVRVVRTIATGWTHRAEWTSDATS